MSSKSSDDVARKRAAETRDQISEMKKTIDRGEAPKNEQVKHLIDEGNKVLETSKQKTTDPEGKQVVQHTQEVLGSVKDFIDYRNHDEGLQKIGEKAAQLFKEVTPSTGAVSNAVKEVKSNVTREDKQRAKQLMMDLRGVLKIMLTSSNFRKTMSTLFSLLGEIGRNLKDTYKEEEKYPRTFQMEPSEKIEKGIDDATKNLSQTKIDELEDRVHRLIQEIGTSQPLQNFINHFYSITDYMNLHYKAFEEEVGIEKTTSERYLYELMSEIKCFLSQFTSQEVLDDIACSSKKLMKLARDDEGFRNLGSEWRRYLDTTFRNPNSAATEENKRQLRDLVKKTRNELEKSKVSDPFNCFIKSFGKLVEDIQNDPIRSKLDEDVKTLFRDLIFDEYGNISLNQPALDQLRTVILPSILDQLKFIAIPKIHSTSESQEFTVRDIFVSVPDIMPEKINIENRMTASMEPKKLDVDKAHSILYITLKDIELHIKNAKVHFKRFTFPKMEDNLIVNFDVSGPSTYIHMAVRVDKVTERGTTYLKFGVQNVETKLDNLKIKAIEGKHDTLMNFVTTILHPMIKARIQKQVSDKISEALDRTCYLFNETSRNTIPKLMSRKPADKPTSSTTTTLVEDKTSAF